MQALSDVENLLAYLPTFYNLASLKASVDDGYDWYDYTTSALVYILQKSPNLECFEVPRVGFQGLTV